MPFWRRVGGGGESSGPQLTSCVVFVVTRYQTVWFDFLKPSSMTHTDTHTWIGIMVHGRQPPLSSPFPSVALHCLFIHSFMWLQCVWKTSAAVPLSVRSAANHLRVVHQWFNIKWADRAIGQDRGLGGFLISLGSASQFLFCFIFDSFLSRKRGR